MNDWNDWTHYCDSWTYDSERGLWYDGEYFYFCKEPLAIPYTAEELDEEEELPPPPPEVSLVF